MTRVRILLLLGLLLSLHPAPGPVLAAGRPDAAAPATVPAQEGEPGPRMGHEPWPGTNWGLIAAYAYSVIALASAVAVVGLILSWPHRRR